MKRQIVILMAGLVLASMVLAGLAAACSVSWSTVEQGVYSGAARGPGGDNLVIRDQATWEAFWAEHKSWIFPMPDVPSVDLSENMVIASIMGNQPTGGYGLSISMIRGGSHHLQVRVLETAPGAGCVVTQAVTNPFHIVETPIADHVSFDERYRVVDCL